jgi:hypothetical protein
VPGRSKRQPDKGALGRVVQRCDRACWHSRGLRDRPSQATSRGRRQAHLPSAVTQRRPWIRFGGVRLPTYPDGPEPALLTVGPTGSVIGSLAGILPGRAARGSVSPRKAICRVRRELSIYGPRSPTRALPDKEQVKRPAGLGKGKQPPAKGRDTPHLPGRSLLGACNSRPHVAAQ